MLRIPLWRPTLTRTGFDECLDKLCAKPGRFRLFKHFPAVERASVSTAGFGQSREKLSICNFYAWFNYNGPTFHQAGSRAAGSRDQDSRGEVWGLWHMMARVCAGRWHGGDSDMFIGLKSTTNGKTTLDVKWVLLPRRASPD